MRAMQIDTGATMPAKHDKRVLRWFRRIKIHEITITGSVPVTSAPKGVQDPLHDVHYLVLYLLVSTVCRCECLTSAFTLQYTAKCSGTALHHNCPIPSKCKGQQQSKSHARQGITNVTAPSLSSQPCPVHPAGASPAWPPSARPCSSGTLSSPSAPRTGRPGLRAHGSGRDLHV